MSGDTDVKTISCTTTYNNFLFGEFTYNVTMATASKPVIFPLEGYPVVENGSEVILTCVFKFPHEVHSSLLSAQRSNCFVYWQLFLWRL